MASARRRANAGDAPSLPSSESVRGNRLNNILKMPQDLWLISPYNPAAATTVQAVLDSSIAQNPLTAMTIASYAAAVFKENADMYSKCSNFGEGFDLALLDLLMAMAGISPFQKVSGSGTVLAAGSNQASRDTVLDDMIAEFAAAVVGAQAAPLKTHAGTFAADFDVNANKRGPDEKGFPQVVRSNEATLSKVNYEAITDEVMTWIMGRVGPMQALVLRMLQDIMAGDELGSLLGNEVDAKRRVGTGEDRSSKKREAIVTITSVDELLRRGKINLRPSRAEGTAMVLHLLGAGYASVSAGVTVLSCGCPLKESFADSGLDLTTLAVTMPGTIAKFATQGDELAETRKFEIRCLAKEDSLSSAIEIGVARNWCVRQGIAIGAANPKAKPQPKALAKRAPKGFWGSAATAPGFVAAPADGDFPKVHALSGRVRGLRRDILIYDAFVTAGKNDMIGVLSGPTQEVARESMERVLTSSLKVGAFPWAFGIPHTIKGSPDAVLRQAASELSAVEYVLCKTSALQAATVFKTRNASGEIVPLRRDPQTIGLLMREMTRQAKSRCATALSIEDYEAGTAAVMNKAKSAGTVLATQAVEDGVAQLDTLQDKLGTLRGKLAVTIANDAADADAKLSPGLLAERQAEELLATLSLFRTLQTGFGTSKRSYDDMELEDAR